MKKEENERGVAFNLNLDGTPIHHFTRLFKKRMAPQGFIFLVVKIKEYKMAYEMSALVSFDFTKNEDDVAELIDKMVISLKQKYNL